jgi:hypothetical protein
VPPQRQCHRNRREHLVVRRLGRIPRQERRVGVPSLRGRAQPVRIGDEPGHDPSLGDGYGVPPHAQVTFDSPGDRMRRHHLAAKVRVLRVEFDHRVHVGRRATHVDHRDVAMLLGDHLDPAKHHVRCCRPYQFGERRVLRQVLPADHVR